MRGDNYRLSTSRGLILVNYGENRRWKIILSSGLDDDIGPKRERGREREDGWSHPVAERFRSPMEIITIRSFRGLLSVGAPDTDARSISLVVR